MGAWLWRLLLPQGYAGAAEDGGGFPDAFAHRRGDSVVNDNRKRAMGRKVIKALGGDARGKTWRCSPHLQAQHDDMRDGTSLALIQALEDGGAKVRAYDPEGIEQARPLLPHVHFAESPMMPPRAADALAIVTNGTNSAALDLSAWPRS